jgi:hypothetical protein
VGWVQKLYGLKSFLSADFILRFIFFYYLKKIYFFMNLDAKSMNDKDFELIITDFFSK